MKRAADEEEGERQRSEARAAVENLDRVPTPSQTRRVDVPRGVRAASPSSLSSHSASSSNTMPKETALYDILGVSPNASEGDIKKAYRKMAMVHHPDKNPDNPEAGQKFQEIGAAYEILSDAEARQVYDEVGLEGMTRGGGGGPAGMDDILNQFFGGMQFGFDFGAGGPGGPGRRRGRGDDQVVPYDVTLEDLYNGKTIKLDMEREALCAPCKGSGSRGNAKPKQCAKCEGHGFTFVQRRIAGGMFGTSRAECTECQGAGEVFKEKDRCKKCKGKKTVKEKNRQEIHIERGMPDRHRIVLAAAGDQQPGVPAGDVIFMLKTQRHPTFERSDVDLLTKVKITLSEALTGFSRILLTHLDGRGINVTSPPGKVIKPGQTIVVRNEGMPTFKRPDERGNLYVVLDVEFPEDGWLATADHTALSKLLPPKKTDLEPRPAIVDDVDFEEADLIDFGEGGEEAWVDEEDLDDEDDDEEQPECRTQ